MHLHVKLLSSPSEDPCTVCKNSQPVTDLFHVFAGTGNVDFGPICGACLHQRGFECDVEQADMSLGRRPPSKKDKRASNSQERRIAEDIGGRVQPGSGNQDHSKGDVRKKGKLRVEAKLTKARSFTLTREVLDKISGECSPGEKPAVIIDFLHPATMKREDSWVAIPYTDWMEIVDASNKNSGPAE